MRLPYDYHAATPADDLPPVALGAFVPVAYKPDQQLAYVRNPYYWQGDEDGNQLPYFDEILFTDSKDWSMRTLNVLAGSCDLTHVQRYDLQPVVLAASQNPESHFTTHWGTWGVPHLLSMNLSLYAGVENDRDMELRKLFRKKEFRIAVSHLIDRKGMTTGVFPTPATRPWYGGYVTGSGMYDEAMVVKYEYDLDKAKKILSDLGFTDSDGNGILNWPASSAISGQELIIEVQAGVQSPEWVQAAEALVPTFQKGGIDLRVKPVKGGIQTANINSGKWEMIIQRTMEQIIPDIIPASVGPIDDGSPTWHLAGPGGKRDLLPFEQEIQDLLRSSESVADPVERRRIFGKVLKLFTENAYSVGIFEARYLDAFAKRMRNMPGDFPIRLYDWTENNIPIQIRWTPKALQLESQFQHLIVTNDTYK